MQRNLAIAQKFPLEAPTFIHTEVKNPKLGIEPNVQYLVHKCRERDGNLEVAFFVDDIRWYWSTVKDSILLNGNDWEVE